MRIWTLFKIFCALVVLAIVMLSVYFTMHALGIKIPEPAKELFSKWMPEPEPLIVQDDNDDHEKLLAATEMVDIEPGDKAFQKAAELLATGKITEAREKLLFLVNYYPSSNAVPRAKQILSEMNMDDFLSLRNNPHLVTHKVARGDSYLGIAAKHQTTLDCIMHFNGYLELRPLQPGDEMMVMPLNLRVTIEPKRQALTLWNGSTFLKEYRILKSVSSPAALTALKIENKGGVLNGKRVAPSMTGFRASEKTITLGRNLQIVAHHTNAESAIHGFHLDPADTEELALLLRVGNEVEIRP